MAIVASLTAMAAIAFASFAGWDAYAAWSNDDLGPAFGVTMLLNGTLAVLQTTLSVAAARSIRDQRAP